MTSYLGSTPAIPTLASTEFYPDDRQPIEDQIAITYTDIAFVVNDKARSKQYLLVEDITNDVWVDGKAIYTQTYAVPALTAGANNIAHGITTLDTLVDINGTVSNGTNQRPLPYPNPTAANSAAVDVTSTNILITVGAGFGANYAGYITIRYTKV